MPEYGNRYKYTIPIRLSEEKNELCPNIIKNISNPLIAVDSSRLIKLSFCIFYLTCIVFTPSQAI